MMQRWQVQCSCITPARLHLNSALVIYLLMYEAGTRVFFRLDPGPVLLAPGLLTAAVMCSFPRHPNTVAQ